MTGAAVPHQCLQLSTPRKTTTFPRLAGTASRGGTLPMGPAGVRINTDPVPNLLDGPLMVCMPTGKTENR